MINDEQAIELLNLADFLNIATTNGLLTSNHVIAAITPQNAGWEGTQQELDTNAYNLAEWIDSKNSDDLDSVQADLTSIILAGKHPCD